MSPFKYGLHDYCIFQMWSYEAFVNYQETLLVKVFELSVYHAEHCWLSMHCLDTFSVHVVRTLRSFSSVTSCMLNVPVSIILMNHVVRFVLIPHA